MEEGRNNREGTKEKTGSGEAAKQGTYKEHPSQAGVKCQVTLRPHIHLSCRCKYFTFHHGRLIRSVAFSLSLTVSNHMRFVSHIDARRWDMQRKVASCIGVFPPMIIALRLWDTYFRTYLICRNASQECCDVWY